MANAEQTLTNILNAIVDPTRRRILESLKRRGATSLGKSAGLCAGGVACKQLVEIVSTNAP